MALVGIAGIDAQDQSICSPNEGVLDTSYPCDTIETRTIQDSWPHHVVTEALFATNEMAGNRKEHDCEAFHHVLVGLGNFSSE